MMIQYYCITDYDDVIWFQVFWDHLIYIKLHQLMAINNYFASTYYVSCYFDQHFCAIPDILHADLNH